MSARVLRAALYLVCCGVGGLLFYLGGLGFVRSEMVGVDVHSLPHVLLPYAFLMIGMLVGFLVGGRLADRADRFSSRLHDMTTQDLLLGGTGAILGAIVVAVIMVPVATAVHMRYFLVLYLTAMVLGAFVGFETLLAVKGEIGLLFGSRSKEPPVETDLERMKGGKILDTNVIIDGRVLDVCHAGFLQGTIYIPGFVLDELQYIADSADSLKRARGRRGLDILNQMRKDSHVLARDLDHLVPEASPVDVKLVSMAKQLSADIVTNDYNLNKVAELQGVLVLNINQLANSLKPVVMAGEEMSVTVIKEGKELNQGIGYLDDGTMIVVENARRFVGETVDVVVTSVLQTVAGKMIFASPKGDHDREEELLGRNIRSYSSSGQRRKARPQ
ncbi:MAG: TRAM domain-containing protein [Chloroflexi bacterium]|nr:TRAM domain-containing protein [Chloroflexota bacterium]